MPLKPRSPIRRFDVFAEYNRVKNEAGGMPADRAKGDAIWIAKVVAGRRGMPALHEPPPESGKSRAAHGDGARDEAFKSVGGEPQTDATFQREIVDRMGGEFYGEVFRTAIEAAYAEGKRYEDIRDTIRKDWK